MHPLPSLCNFYKNGPFFFPSISPSNLGQISKSGTVLKSAHSQLSKTVPDFEIWPTIRWENWDQRHQVCFLNSQNKYFLPYHRHLSFISIFSAYSWSNFKIRDSFGKLRTCRFQNCPWFWNLSKIWWKNWRKTKVSIFLWTQCMFSTPKYLSDASKRPFIQKLCYFLLSETFFWDTL